jgi:hypothetical protein
MVSSGQDSQWNVNLLPHLSLSLLQHADSLCHQFVHQTTLPRHFECKMLNINQSLEDVCILLSSKYFNQSFISVGLEFQEVSKLA